MAGVATWRVSHAERRRCDVGVVVRTQSMFLVDLGLKSVASPTRVALFGGQARMTQTRGFEFGTHRAFVWI